MLIMVILIIINQIRPLILNFVKERKTTEKDFANDSVWDDKFLTI